MNLEAATAYPLYWPAGRPRAASRSLSRFKVGSFGRVGDELLNELKLMRASDIILSTNLRLRQDGYPLASQPLGVPDPGVAVYFKYKGKEVCFACDRWRSVADNMHAIRLTIAALRGIARWGTGDMVDAAFAGFTALPAPAESWQTTLGVGHGATLEEAEAAYSRLALVHHPDRGGSDEQMAKLNAAIERARKELVEN